MHQGPTLFPLHTNTIISEFLMRYLERVESFVHVIFPQEISDKVINYFQPSNMFGLIVDLFLCHFPRYNTFSECASHKSFQLVDII